MNTNMNTLEQLNNLSDAEKKEVFKILDQISDKGNSDQYKNLIYKDYDEIPVDIDTFLHDPKYLGKGLVNEEGKFTVFDFWVKTLKDIFPDPLQPAKYNTLALTGSIGIGKSFMAVLIQLYELYRMICLKDPYVYYGLQPIDKITFAMMNITLDASKGVAWDKMQQLLQSSPWFMERGTLSGTVNQQWNPPKGIELIAGSLSRHILGRAVYSCLDEDTKVMTTEGVFKIKDLEDKSIQVYSIDDNGDRIISNYCTVKKTAEEIEEYEIELEDGTIIKCTPTHRFMLKDGTYKEAQYLTEEDDLFELNKYGYIYKFTDIVNNKIYIGKREKNYFDESYYGSGKLWKNVLNTVGKDNIKREILQWCYSKEELYNAERNWIKKLQSQDKDIGYNIHKGGAGGNSLNDTENWSELHRGERNGLYNRPVSKETRDKISKTKKNKKVKNEVINENKIYKKE